MSNLRALLALALAACATSSAPIRIVGTPYAMTALTGNWSGTYFGAESHRNGSISFSLRAGDTLAYGDVLMIPAGYEHHEVWTERERHVGSVPRHPAMLTIAFVGVSNERVTGMLDPYTDPDCDCLVVTTFWGRLTNANTLEGTFLTRVPGSAETRRGEWRVTRKATS